MLVAGLGVALKSTVAGQDAQQRLLVAIEQQVSPELSEQIGRALRSREQQRRVARADRLCRPAGDRDRDLSRRSTMRSTASGGSPTIRTKGWLVWLGRLAFQRFKALLMLLARGRVCDCGHRGVARFGRACRRQSSRPSEIAPDVRWDFGLLDQRVPQLSGVHGGLSVCAQSQRPLGRSAPRRDARRDSVGSRPADPGNLPGATRATRRPTA